jgi:hypothetical protein
LLKLALPCVLVFFTYDGTDIAVNSFTATDIDNLTPGTPAQAKATSADPDTLFLRLRVFKGVDGEQKIYLSWSTDGSAWTALADYSIAGWTYTEVGIYIEHAAASAITLPWDPDVSYLCAFLFFGLCFNCFFIF